MQEHKNVLEALSSLLPVLKANRRTMVLLAASSMCRFLGFKVPASPTDELLSTGLGMSRKLVQVVPPVGTKNTEQMQKPWTMPQPLSRQKALRSMHGRFSLAPSDASRNPTLLGWQRRMLAPSDGPRHVEVAERPPAQKVLKSAALHWGRRAHLGPI